MVFSHGGSFASSKGRKDELRLITAVIQQQPPIDLLVRPARPTAEFEMCIITNFSYKCGHPTTCTFRTAVCISPGSPSCVPTQYIEKVSECCKRCNAIWRTGRKQLEPHPPSQDTELAGLLWHIPSRCFTDPGFQRLDPFAADKVKQQVQATEQARAAKHRLGSFGGFRQKWHKMKTSTRDQNTSGSVILRFLPAPCCERHQLWNMCHGRMGKGQQDDDRCMSRF